METIKKKSEQIKFKVSKRKEIVRIRVEINEIQNRKSIETIDETKSCSQKRSVKLISLWLVYEKRERTQITNIRNERGNMTTDPMEIKRIIKIYHE